MFLPAHLVAPSLHLLYEFLPVAGYPHNRLYRGDEPELPALSPHSGPVFPCAQTRGPVLLPVWLESGQAVFYADLVADLPHLIQGIWREVQFLSGVRVDGVDDQMRVQVFRVDVCGHQNLAAWEEPLRQFLSDFVRFRRRDFLFGGEGLDVLVEEGSAGFSVEVLGCQEAFLRQFRRAVDTGEIAAAGFVHRLFLL